jgi:hypothetical protein
VFLFAPVWVGGPTQVRRPTPSSAPVLFLLVLLVTMAAPPPEGALLVHHHLFCALTLPVLKLPRAPLDGHVQPPVTPRTRVRRTASLGVDAVLLAERNASYDDGAGGDDFANDGLQPKKKKPAALPPQLHDVGAAPASRVTAPRRPPGRPRNNTASGTGTGLAAPTAPFAPPAPIDASPATNAAAGPTADAAAAPAGVLCVVCGVWCVVCGVWCVVWCVWWVWCVAWWV